MLAGVAILALVATWVAVTPDGPWAWERGLTREVAAAGGWATPLLEAVMQFGTRGAALVAGVVVAVAAGRRAGVATVAAGLAAWAVTALVKPLADRPRPSLSTLGMPVRQMIDEPGFPSGHAAISAALALAVCSLARPRPSVAAALVAAAVLTAVARVHLGVHWPLDVIGGAAVGTLAGAGAVTWARRRRRA